eukprot:TRINITY_DN4873_c0_g1_i1.p2 TRINITY_DN4873_c0_g1~~TRINITY_DN4873_c0_g1_i1.p2  ORF type:complete len:97 (-),score=12.45 TRINITY_DN4873_c0_g1_i1:348-638(-)
MHMHKAGGTMIDFLFRKKKKAGKQINGNPWVKNEIVEYWRYNRTALETYRQELVSKGVEYIALEWNFLPNTMNWIFPNFESSQIFEIRILDFAPTT